MAYGQAGRPAELKNPKLVGCNMGEDDIQALDAFAEHHGCRSRSEAVRLAIKIAYETTVKAMAQDITEAQE
jgi:metal-responsive CopG/Arc/MetJ family transcriptional regulator